MGERPKTKILIVEDERDIAESVADGLMRHGYDVTHAPDGQTAIRKFDMEQWDLVLLDLMLPDMPGDSVLSYLQQQVDYPSILVLTAKNQIGDKLALFRQGCDDYLTKPFVFDELLVRVEALLRRPPRVRTETFDVGDLVLDPSNHQLRRSDRSVVLTPKETAFLRVLLQPPGRIVSRRELLNSVWGLKDEPVADYIGIHLFNLRKKLGEIDRGDWLQTVRSAGYVFEEPKERTGDH